MHPRPASGHAHDWSIDGSQLPAASTPRSTASPLMVQPSYFSPSNGGHSYPTSILSKGGSGSDVSPGSTLPGSSANTPTTRRPCFLLRDSSSSSFRSEMTRNGSSASSSSSASTVTYANANVPLLPPGGSSTTRRFSNTPNMNIDLASLVSSGADAVDTTAWARRGSEEESTGFESLLSANATGEDAHEEARVGMLGLGFGGHKRPGGGRVLRRATPYPDRSQFIDDEELGLGGGRKGEE